MLRKMLVILCIAIIFIVGSQVYVTNQQYKIPEYNPFMKDDLHPKTIQQLHNEHYQNVILPSELEQMLRTEEKVYVYYYASTCPACERLTPIIVPLSKDIGIDLKLFNLLEFEEGWDQYNIKVTPTVVMYRKGTEIKRLEGLMDSEKYEEIFNEYN